MLLCKINGDGNEEYETKAKHYFLTNKKQNQKLQQFTQFS